MVAHLKTLFLFPNMSTQFEQQTRKQLIQAANAYAHLLGKVFVLESPSFVNRPRYLIRFFATNFLHLSGVETNLSPKDFFTKCFSGQIAYGEFWDSSRKNKNTIRKKLRNLINVDSIFDFEVFVQEDFVKNAIHCVIATTDGRFTMGFVDNRNWVVPNTILDSNHLSSSKPILRLAAKTI